MCKKRGMTATLKRGRVVVSVWMRWPLLATSTSTIMIVLLYWHLVCLSLEREWLVFLGATCRCTGSGTIIHCIKCYYLIYLYTCYGHTMNAV